MPIPVAVGVTTYAPFSANNLMPPFSSGISTIQQQQPANSISYGMQYVPNEFAAPRKTQDLPHFSGEPEDWPLFLTAYNQSTATNGYTNIENNHRL